MRNSNMTSIKRHTR